MATTSANALAWASSETFKATQYIKARPHYPNLLVDLVFAYHKQRPDAKFDAGIDLGCGPGQLALHLAAVPFDKVYGIDPASKFIQLANALQNLPKEEGAALSLPTPPPKPIEYIVGSADKTTLPDHSVDLVMAGCTAHWWGMGDPEVKKRTWSEIARILRPGGTMAVLGLFPSIAAAKSPDPRILELQKALAGVILDSDISKYWPARPKMFGDLPLPEEESEEWDMTSKLFFDFDFPEHLASRLASTPYQNDPIPNWAPKELRDYETATSGSLSPSKTTPKAQANFIRSGSGYLRYLDEHPEEKGLIESDGDWVAREVKKVCLANGIGYEEEIEAKTALQAILFRRK